MSNPLESLVKTIAEKKALVKSEKEVKELNNPHVVRTKMGKINRAKEDLKELYKEYRTEIQKGSTFILVSGKQAKKFAELASAEFGCFSLDPNTFYNEILDQVPEQLYVNKTAGPALFDHFMAKFESRALEIEIIGYTPLIFESKHKRVLKGREDALKLLQEAFNDRVGGEVVGLDAIDRVAFQAVNEDFAGNTVPIVLFSEDDDLLLSLSKDLKKISYNVFIISTGTKGNKELKQKSISSLKTVDVEGIKSSLTKVKENLR